MKNNDPERLTLTTLDIFNSGEAQKGRRKQLPKLTTAQPAVIDDLIYSCHCLQQLSSTVHIIRIIFLVSYARILTYETLSYCAKILGLFKPL